MLHAQVGLVKHPLTGGSMSPCNAVAVCDLANRLILGVLALRVNKLCVQVQTNIGSLEKFEGMTDQSLDRVATTGERSIPRVW